MLWKESKEYYIKGSPKLASNQRNHIKECINAEGWGGIRNYGNNRNTVRSKKIMYVYIYIYRLGVGERGSILENLKIIVQDKL